jgi:lactate permease
MDWALSSIPIVVILVVMLLLRRSAAVAGALGWITAALVAALGFGAGWEVLFYAQLKGLLTSTYVIYIIWGALLFYRVTSEAGVVRTLGTGLARLTTDRGEQALLLGWVFSSFLQGVGGFGIPVAVVAPLLVELGFPAIAAVVITSIGHTWAVTFGSLGASFHALIAATGRTGTELAPWSAILLGLACFACGVGALSAAGSQGKRRASLALIAVVGLPMAGVQYLAATSGLWSVASMLGGLTGLGVAVVWVRYRARNRNQARKVSPEARVPSAPWPLAPYALLVLIVLLAQLEPIGRLLDQVVLSARFPELRTGLGFATPACQGRAISVFGHTGALLTYASLLAFGLGSLRGWYRDGAGASILRSVFKQLSSSALAIIALVGMAATMEHAGMTQVLADGMVGAVGAAFPLVSPFVGALGALVTGSNTSSNLLLAPLQREAAVLAGVSPLLILAAQTAGASVGSAIAPSKIVVGCSTVEADEAGMLSKTAPYVILVVAGLAALTGVTALLLSR